MIILLIAGLIKKTLYKISQYFPKPFEPFGGDINVTVDLSNYATKYDIKNITHVNTSSFALKTNLPNLKTEVDKLDIEKLATVPVDLSKLSNVIKNDVVKKTVYDKLVAKVNNIDTSDFVLKKIPSISGLVKKTDYNTKISDIENKLNNHNHDKYVATSKFNTLAADVFNARLAQTNLITKTDFHAKFSCKS